MLNQQTIEKLHAMKLHGMADAFHTQLETTDTSQLSFEERLALLVDQQWLWKENRALGRRLRFAHLKERGVIEDVDYQHPRGLDRKLMRTLATSEWVRQHQNLLLLRSEIIELRTLDVDDPNNLILQHQRYRQFGTNALDGADVTRIVTNIGDQDGLPALRCHARNALP